MKKAFPYILVALAASMLTLLVYVRFFQPQQSKLDELQALIEDCFIGEADSEALENAAAASMVNATGDRWSYYLTEEELAAHKEQNENSYVGIGITIQVREDELGFDILRVEPNSPAEEAGLLAGDILIRAEGQAVVPLGTSGARSVILGPVGTQVSIDVLRDGAERSFSVTRRKIDTVVASGVMLDHGIGMVHIVNFNDRCAKESIAAIESLLEQGAKAIVFDVRFNPGGFVHELVALLDYLLPEGELFRSVNYKGQEDVKTSDAAFLDIPMAVLVNEESYSAAEFFAAVLREYDAAVVIGTPTVGKGYYQVTYTLSDGSAVGLSVGKYYTPGGVSLAEEGGLVPDVTVELEEEKYYQLYAGTLAPQEDPQVQEAVQYLTTP